MIKAKSYYWARIDGTIYVVFLNANRTVIKVGINKDAPSPNDSLKEIKVKNGRIDDGGSL